LSSVEFLVYEPLFTIENFFDGPIVDPKNYEANVVVATLRSRGLTVYDADDDGPVYEVDDCTKVTLDFSGTYESVKKNPFAPFGVNVINKDNQFTRQRLFKGQRLLLGHGQGQIIELGQGQEQEQEVYSGIK
jgi:hypothetical protein